jgi:hypothetical protein
MGVIRFILFSLISSLLCADVGWRVENSNFLLSQASLLPGEDTKYTYDYDRFRLRGDWKEASFFATGIGDVVNYIGASYIDSPSFSYLDVLNSDTTFATQSLFHSYANDKAAIRARLYRLYGGYDDGRNRIVVGLQNITMGIGHIWTPSNLFNPINTYALEPDETYGVAAITGTHYIGEQSQLYAAMSRRRDGSFKYAGGGKTTVGMIEVALNGIRSKDTKMLGYTIEGDLSNTGIELRSEGAWIKATIDTPAGLPDEKEFFQGIIGVDYAFRQGLDLTVEALYSSDTFTYTEILANLNGELRNDLVMSHFYMGTMLSYDFTIYLSGSLLYIESFNDENSCFVAPSVTYTINDNNTLMLGAQINSGTSDSEFGAYGNSYYLKYVLSF